MSERSIHVVSGGASGIGLAIVHRLLARGDEVVVVDRSPAPDELGRDGVTYFQQDVSDLVGVAAAATRILNQYPRVASVVASAGLERVS
ncbi:SDR family NAD(P)-dependent oxidoreductase [Rhodococcus sovatensis]|uniref:SDR family NAD(P)-dependent oxidoreductase n=1 Tax=Rhodococcus sovatensis TaxID=1805840 RepID=A0ABZ2PLA9_9NOCA